MTTPTENPTCKHCGQSKSDHRPANYNDGVTIGQFLVCPFATFEAETETNLSGQRNSTSREEVVAEYPNKASMPAQNLSPAQEKLCEAFAGCLVSKFSGRDDIKPILRQFLREALALREPAPQAESAADIVVLALQADMAVMAEEYATLERENAELRRKLDELQQHDPDAEVRLWPCPFCGFRDGTTEEHTDGSWTVECQTCGAGTGCQMDEIEAIVAWHCRVELPPPSAAELKAELLRRGLDSDEVVNRIKTAARQQKA